MMLDLWDDEDGAWDGEDDGPPEDGPDLGPCCACERTGPSVRNVLMLHRLAPIAGRGWGCLECGATMDGAVAVVCDDCLESDAPLRFACLGWPGADGRVPIDDLVGTHDHDLSRHPELAP
jgi:hypothetical protein